jgi:hypothetical protein
MTTSNNRAVPIAAVLSFAVFIGPVWAQGTPKRSGTPISVPSNTIAPADAPKPPAPPAAEPIVVPAPPIAPRGAAGGAILADEVFRIDAVGLTMRIPSGAMSGSSQIGGKTSASIGPADGSWAINIQLPRTSNPDSTVKQALDQTLLLLQDSVGISDAAQSTVLSTEARIIEKIDALRLPGGDAARLYMSLPEPNRSSRIVKGYTIFKPSPTQYAVFEFIVPEADFSKTRTMYETSIGTVDFVASVDLQKRRGSAVQAGSKVIEGLSADDVLAAMQPEGQEQWFRMYKPAVDGNAASEVELGYYGLTFWRGQRGEINAGKAASAFTPAERQEGWLVRVRSRILSDKVIADNLGVFFMTPDRREEAWMFTTAVRGAEGKVQAVATETGARDGDQLQVVKTEPGKPTSNIQPPIMGEGYITQVETFILPRVLARKGLEGEFGWYAYQAWPAGTITFRKDTARLVQGPTGRSTRVTTLLREDSPEQVTTFSPTGESLGVEFADGTVRLPTDPAELKRIWQQKGLPTDR